VNFVLEAGHRNAGDALRVFNEIKADRKILWRSAIGSLTFGTKEDFPALQAADMLAYWLNKAKCHGLAERRNYISYFESQLHKAGLTILDHVIDLKNMRQNFLRKRKKPIFGIAELDNTDWKIDPTSLYVPGYVPPGGRSF
jgi:hypothetical protein